MAPSLALPKELRLTECKLRIRSAACTSSSKAPASNLPTQIRISWREMSWRLESACRVSPAMNSSATCRLNAALWDRCFVMASILRKPSKGGSIQIASPVHPPGAHSTLPAGVGVDRLNLQEQVSRARSRGATWRSSSTNGTRQMRSS